MSDPIDKPSSGFSINIPGHPAYWITGLIILILFFALHFWAFLFLAGFAAGWWVRSGIRKK